MSHEATNWAIKQRGLKPTTKIVLWHLCDRFNPDYGCFPSQDRLAHDCEISRSTLNDHLGQLEAVGLLRRVPRLDPVTKRQLPTRYILGFEPGFTPVAVVPCPEIGHGDDGATESLDDAEACARALGCRYTTIPIQPAVAGFDEMLADDFSDMDVDITEENLQSRIRGVTLMALSNKFGPMLVTTGNKSEMSVGYATIYGDMSGGYNPLKDAYKGTVFNVSRWRNHNKPKIGLGPDGPVIPENIICKPPTAELRPDQKDSDSLPPYEILDPILLGLVEHEKGVDQLVSEGFDREMVIRIERLLNIAEYKRRQAPPGVKLTMRNFGRDRRYPITHSFRSA